MSLITSKGHIFRVTPKTADKSQNEIDRGEIKAQIFILALILLSVGFSAVNVLWAQFFSYSSTANMLIAAFWSAFNIYILAAAIHDVAKRLYFRQDYRFPIELNGAVLELAGTPTVVKIKDISYSGASAVMLTGSSGLKLGERIQLKIVLPDSELYTNGRVAYVRSQPDGTKRIGVKFEELPTASRRQLVYFLFVTVPRLLYATKYKKLFTVYIGTDSSVRNTPI